jgi:hypothetical protein
MMVHIKINYLLYHNKKLFLDSKLLVEWDNLRKMMWKENQHNKSPGGFLKAIHYVAKHKG